MIIDSGISGMKVGTTLINFGVAELIEDSGYRIEGRGVARLVRRRAQP
jgi:hypothetical protein